MKVLVLAGGSGGHVTPAVAVIRELKQRHPHAEIKIWCDRKYAPQTRRLVHNFDSTIPVQTVLSGKLRRYHHLSKWRHFISPSVVFLNSRDVFLVIGGFIQSIAKFIAWRPDVVFAKGGFVSVPSGIAARIFKIPLVIHDSDSHPGLANRILARHATFIATGTPLDNYPYDRKRAYYTGIPISKAFRPYTDEERRKMKDAIGFEPDCPLVVVTGGGLGARSINNAVASQLTQLLGSASVLLLSGTTYYDELRAFLPQDDEHFQLRPFVDSKEMAQALGAADIVVSRAGATTILELSALAKPTILIPAAQLAAGHQIKNAAEYAKKGAVGVITDRELAANPQVLADMIDSLLANPTKRDRMATKFHATSKYDAAQAVAELVEKAAKK
jgi:UDP-N-acetylglucosamine--N-acetylmuramyl-(pentapeptide) pyrophosphoryl-undecaprenol N-acetylglucosamine transferase